MERLSPLPAPAAPHTPDTPVHQRAQQHSSNDSVYQQPAYLYAAHELQDKYVFATPESFLAKHLPDLAAGPTPHIDQDALKIIASKTNEKEMYTPLVHHRGITIKTGWNLMNTSEHADPDSKFILETAVKPEISLYGPNPPFNKNVCRSCDAECFMELKTDLYDDPFEDTDEGVIEKASAKARDTRGQIITYLNAMQASQFRTHSFGAVIVKNKCHFLRLTRSGIEVSSSFNYTSSSLLAMFFWRLSNATAESRGLDTSFERLSPFSALDARKLLDAVDKPLWKVSIGDRSFYVSDPFTRAHYLPIGRSTRCFVAIECETGRKCVLKDTWRVDGYHPEANVYARLQAHNVRNIPKVVAAGDVPNHVCGDYDDYPLTWRAAKPEAIRHHHHYRIVLDVVGKPLVEFASSHELVQCVLNALEAHYDAWTKAHVKHRDISVSNIIIVVNDDGTTTGLLIDWELARFEDDGAYERTGTRQFMSVRLCAASSPPPARTLADELESFLWVLLWIAAAYSPSTMSAMDRTTTLNDFDDPLSKLLIIMSAPYTIRHFFISSPHLEDLLLDLLVPFKSQYLSSLPPSRLKPEEGPIANVAVTLASHDWMMECIQTKLENKEWKVFLDPGAAQAVAVPEFPRLKRKSWLSEYTDSAVISVV
ncbi:hypothetical protein B0H17DRAFT_1178970 [Mycena rosella]|uniref:Fungal-type protein kinase domain-containing protein n=1 Tax=Mycena rosella TaxID=1033263 RepID=A0AAD7DKD3_MYCRO|nr:hypothetical protein B0H17DRAFT_1178970 [Mycena rosella]